MSTVPVDLWWADTRAHLGDPRELLRFLDVVERQRLAALRSVADRERFVLAAALSRVVVGDWLGVAPAQVPLRRDCPDCVRPHGRPVVVGATGRPPVHSISHTGRWVAVAVAAEGRIGVDVEVVDPDRPLPRAMVLHPVELARGDDAWRAWVRKEAVLKATGEGLRRRPTELVWTASPERPRSGRVAVGDGRGSVLQVLDLTAPAGVVAAVAADRPPLVRAHDGVALLHRVLTQDVPLEEVPCPA